MGNDEMPSWASELLKEVKDLRKENEQLRNNVRRSSRGKVVNWETIREIVKDQKSISILRAHYENGDTADLLHFHQLVKGREKKGDSWVDTGKMVRKKGAGLSVPLADAAAFLNGAVALVNHYSDGDNLPPVESEPEPEPEVEEEPEEFICDLCGFEASSKGALGNHKGKAKCRKLQKEKNQSQTTTTAPIIEDDDELAELMAASGFATI